MESLSVRYINAKRAVFDRAYADLNPEQRRAVYTVNGPLLILAGAGSGKTTVLVKRIAHIIRYGNAYFDESTPAGLTEGDVARLEGAAQLEPEQLQDVLPEFISDPCPPWRVLAITFTNKAANEIKNRLAGVLGDESISREIWAGTFHSICMRILRKHGEKLGYAQNCTIYDTDDQKKLLQSVMKQLNIDEKVMPVKGVLNKISRAKDKLMTPDAFEADAGSDFSLRQVARIYRAYQEQLKAAGALDFDDIIMQTVFLLRDFPEVLDEYARRFRYVCVDEYQDTNQAQFALTALFASHHRNLMVVGDDDQSIYKFRGATIANILEFDRNFDDAAVIRLEQNYRSTGNILGAANEVIAHNKGRKGKTLWTAAGEGEKIRVKKCDNQNAEARYIIDTVNTQVADGKHKYRDFAILYRMNAQSGNIERAFAKSGIPYRMLGGVRFTDRKEIRDIVAYLQLINNHSDKERLKRIINEPKRKIGPKAVETVEMLAAAEGVSMYEVMQRANVYPELANYAARLRDFTTLIDDLTELSASIPLSELVEQTLDRTGYRQMLIDGGEEEAERLENIDEFRSGVLEYEQGEEEPTLTGFLEETALVADVDRYDETADAVVMMTIHSAKGLEFPVVFLPGMEEGLFPTTQSAMEPDELEEERRLAYVAITRAKEKLVILHTRERLLFGATRYNPISRFVSEIPEGLIVSDTFGKKAAAQPQQPQQRPKRPQHTDTLTIGTSPRPKAERAPTFAPGDNVSHLTFGQGTILSVTPMGADTLYEVMFEKVGTKRLMATYARLKKLD
ncbi:MAG: UvrD-helicase domain-containing protein [Clostridia bacterium]|nr:UvrD-helicase domain-containing protein [Clostridia bacterium]